MRCQSRWLGSFSTEVSSRLHADLLRGSSHTASCASRQTQQSKGHGRQQCWHWQGCRRWGAVAQARRGGALQELKEMQKVDVEASPVGKCIPDDCKALNIAAFVKDAQGNYITLHIAVSKLEWQSPLKIILYPDPRLRAKNARIGSFDDNLRRFSEELLAVMYNASDGVGLAAPQVGVNVRLMVFNPTGVKGEEEFVLVNPKLIHTNKRKDVEEEGCLSFPKIYGDVERPTQIKIRAQDLSGERMDVTFEGWQARIFQHEFDHLQGVLFHDRMSVRELSKVKGQLQQLEDAFQRGQPDVQIQRVA